MIAVVCSLAAAGAHSAQVAIDAPFGSGEFGDSVTVLPNGNILVIDPLFDAPGPVENVGAVYLYRPSGELISTLRGSSFDDRVGSGGVVVLTNGNFVVRSPGWNDGSLADVGAVTFGSGVAGVDGEVSAANSLVGASEWDRVGRIQDFLGSFNGLSGVTALANGNYVVASPEWDRGAIADAGAVTLGSGTSGVRGVVSIANSLVGATAQDRVGATFNGSGVTALANGNFVVGSPYWNRGALSNAGAATFASGITGISGEISLANSLLGSSAEDGIGFSVTPLTNGNYVASSIYWDNGASVNAGAVTFGSGESGISGEVSPLNSLVGSSANDVVSDYGVTVLANGNYLVRSPRWNRDQVSDVGAVTFGSGEVGISGVVSPANSLVGATAGDAIGSFGITELANGNYVVSSRDWDNGAIRDAGAVTFGSGTVGISGEVSPANSLVGSQTLDNVGRQPVVALANGNYVVSTPSWDNGMVPNVGAATFASGLTGIVGEISSSNSLVGSVADDFVGGVTALANGNYLVMSPGWDRGAIVNAGAATLGSGVSGITGVVSSTNSLVGGSENDQIGSFEVAALANGNYVVRVPFWDRGGLRDAGAVVFGNGESGIIGEISVANALVGTAQGEQLGFWGVTTLANGSYAVSNPGWSGGGVAGAGAVTFGSGETGISGEISAANSLVGSSPFDQLDSEGIMALPNGNYVVRSRYWDNGAIRDAGAVTLGLLDGSVTGPIDESNSVLGLSSGNGFLQRVDYDAHRNQLVVGQPASNRVVLHRPGIATAISISADAPDPSIVSAPVVFTATLTALPSAPTDGRVTFTASSGESCTSTTPAPISIETVEFSCALIFSAAGTSTVTAEYTGSIIHAYSGSAPEPHTTLIDPLFVDGFESP